MKPLVYVAGPIASNPWGCVRGALDAARIIEAAGCVAYLPQLSVLAEIVQHRQYEDWVAHGLEMVSRCDAVYRINGISSGADREVELATALGKPTWFDGPHALEQMTNFVDRWNKGLVA